MRERNAALYSLLQIRRTSNLHFAFPHSLDPERSSDWADCGHSRTLLRLTKPAIPEIRIFLAYIEDTLTNFRTNSIVKIQV
ncbi:hypothetical protein BVI434_2590002 [Burkholderia vietnamiensis]|nr:hypothetical protein BVI434_2590002 [Burkholderia vietnamiensis]